MTFEVIQDQSCIVCFQVSPIDLPLQVGLVVHQLFIQLWAISTTDRTLVELYDPKYFAFLATVDRGLLNAGSISKRQGVQTDGF